ncbi:MAG: flagellar type III secretion system pore protein FliP [Desulfobacterales bacterium]|nr:flagellar type III secretion system pore protein FliP [Desulfobacterales bacterium]
MQDKTKDILSGKRIFLLALFVFHFALFFLPTAALCATVPLPSVQIGVGQADNPQQVSVLLQVVALLTVLSLAPAILVLMTSFTRLAVVFSFLRHALGTHQMPPNQIMIGLALFLTFFIMMPVWRQVNDRAIKPYLDEEMTQVEALKAAMDPVRQFMFRQTRKKDLALFTGMAKLEKPNTPLDVPTSVLIPAFVVSELKTAFIIGFVLYVPFLIIDMVVASVLLSMGMMMLPPIMISMPFKLILFVLVDGWYLIVGSLVRSFVSG